MTQSMTAIKRRFREQPWLLPAVVFFLDLTVLVLVTNYPRQMRVYTDELHYLDNARSLAAGQGISLRGMPSDYQKILYSIFLIPAMCLGSTRLQIMAVGWTNCLLAASTVFPVWLLCRRLSCQRRETVFMLLATVLYPTMAFTASFMSESLFLPLSVWMGYAVVCALQAQGQKRGSLVSLLAGVLCYAVYLCKEIGLYYLLAYLAVCLWEALLNAGTRRSKLLSALWFTVGFAVPFLLMKSTLFAGMGNSYGLTSMLDGPHLLYMLYAILYYTIFTLLAFGVLPVLALCTDFPYLHRQQTVSEQFRLYLLFSLVIGIAGVGYTITPREEYLSWVPALHLRYLEPLGLLILVSALPVLRRTWPLSRKNGLLLCTAVWALLHCIVGGRVRGWHCNNTMLQWVEALSNKLEEVPVLPLETKLLLLRIVISAVVLICTVLFCRQGKAALPWLGTALLAVNLFSLRFELTSYRWIYGINPAVAAEMDTLDADLDAVSGNVLLVPTYTINFDSFLYETYVDRLTYVAEIPCLRDTGILDDGVVDLQTETLFNIYNVYTGLRSVEYLVAPDTVEFAPDTVELIQEYPLSGYRFYKNTDPARISIAAYPSDAS